MRIGVIGVGRMGKPIASHVSRAGFRVCYYDPRPNAAATGERLGSCKEVSLKADIVLILVGTDRQVKSCFAGPDGLLACPTKRKVFVIVSTIHPGTLQSVRDLAERKGAKVLDAPVVWGEKGAVQGTLVTYVGGDRRSFLRGKRVLSAYSKKVFYLGPSGSGLVAKTANNHLMWTCRFANFEVLELASRYYSGDMNALLRALLAGTGSNVCLERLSSPGGEIPWAQKDVRIVIKMARDKRLSPLFARAVQLALRQRDYHEFNRQGIRWLVKKAVKDSL
jgi:3-hydroxyisobutyrate dehydrogenase-like beta-hydroxyacid dehydrogenase